ncbi:reverse transcriptase domain-containing protein [Tanacetum coccineum]
MLKFPVPGGILTLRSSRIIPLECTMVSKPEAQPSSITQAAEERIRVAIHLEYPEQTIAIGSTLKEDRRKALCELLRRNLDIFSWKPKDMKRVPRHLAEHRLNFREGCLPVRQKERSQAPKRNKEIQEEVAKPLDTEIMKEVHYHSWLSNPVMNARATYQQLVDKAFQNQIGRNLEVYVDDLLIKSRTKQEIIRDIEEMFRILREINMKLNPKKCTFRVEEGMFLGYKVNTKGIKVCSDKVDTVLSPPSSKCLKDVQKLNGKLARLNRFLSKSAEKSLPFFKALKKCTKKSDFQWTTETEAAFKQMKKLTVEPPTLTAPMEKEELIVYLTATREAVSAMLMTEREAKQMPVFFVSHALQGPKINYTPLEKLVLALVHASKRLKDTSKHIQSLSSRTSQLSRTRTSVKGKILADFIVERQEDDSLVTTIEAEEELLDPWAIFMDGSSCIDANNKAEYKALIAGLRITEQMGIKNLQANVESRLVPNQVKGSYIAKESGMIQYLKKVKTLANSFKKFIIKQVPRSENKKADALSKITSTSFAHLTKQVQVEELNEKSINEAEVLAVVEEKGDTWMTPIYEYLTEETLHAEKEKARAVQGKSRRYAVIKGVLYKKSYLGPWLRKMIQECQDCQVHRPMPRNPQQKLTPIMSSWPFYKWGIDIAEPFPKGPGKVKFLIAAIDYFTNWIEAYPVATITGITHSNISVKSCASASALPLKDWIEEIPHVLWAQRTMIKSSNGDTPFLLTYGMEAVIPAEIGMPTLRTSKIDVVPNDEALEINLDLLEEIREQAAIREARSKAKMERYYNSKVRNTSFKPGDLMYRNNDASHAKDSETLGPKWEGPYEVMEALGKEAYKFRDRNGEFLSRT